jgi:hypothetical protein
VAVRQAQARRCRRVRAVDHRGVEPGSVGVDGRGRIGRIGAGRGIDDGTGDGNDRSYDENWVARGHDNVDVVDAVSASERQVVIDELAPGVHERGHAFGVRHVRVSGADHEVADGTRIVAAERDGNAVGKMGIADAPELSAGSVELRIGQVVLQAVEAATRAKSLGLFGLSGRSASVSAAQ